MKTTIIITMAALLGLGAGAQADDTNHALRIYRVAIQAAVVLEENATRNHWLLTEAKGERFLSEAEVQAGLKQEHPDPADRAAYRYGFLMWIRPEWATRQ